jgi:hypothetical protein
LTSKSKKKTTRKETNRPIFPMKIDVKILTETLACRIQRHIKRIMYRGKVEFIPGMQGWLNICQSINVTHHINKMKDKTHTAISTVSKKSIPQSSMCTHD